MDYIESEGKTEKEATQRALNRIGATEEEVKIEVYDNQPEGGPVKVKVIYDKKKISMARAKEVLENILAKMDMSGEIQGSEREDALYMNIFSEKKGLLIGRRGETINALQHIVNRIVNKDVLEKVKIVVDTENYKERQKNKIQDLARTEAQKVKETGRESALPPMNAEERRIAHIALSDDEEIETQSVGEDPYRKVIISLKKNR